MSVSESRRTSKVTSTRESSTTEKASSLTCTGGVGQPPADPRDADGESDGEQGHEHDEHARGRLHAVARRHLRAQLARPGSSGPRCAAVRATVWDTGSVSHRDLEPTVTLPTTPVADLPAPGEPLRLMAVHAHPDDESSKGAATHGALRRRGRRGARRHLHRRRARRRAQPGAGRRRRGARRPRRRAPRRDGPRRARSSACSRPGSASRTPGCPSRRGRRHAAAARGLLRAACRSTRRPSRWCGSCASSVRT